MINPSENYAMIICLLTITSIAAGFDIKSHKIPNLLTFPTMMLALIYYTSFHGWEGLYFSVCGLFTGVALLIMPYLMGGMGAGDAKLMGVVGAFLGMKNTIEAFLFIAAMGCVYGLIVIIFNRNRFQGYFKQLLLTAQMFLLTRKYVPVESGVAAMSRPKVYYGIAIAAGTLLYLSFEITGFQISI